MNNQILFLIKYIAFIEKGQNMESIKKLFFTTIALTLTSFLMKI